MMLLLRTVVRRFITVILLGLALTSGVKAQTLSPTVPCPPGGYVLGFFNGVWNDELEARNGLHALYRLVGNTWKGEHVTPKLFYNYGNAPGFNLLFFQDIAETFIQRAQEIDSTGYLGTHFELIWEAAFNSRHSFLTPIALRVAPEVASLIDALYAEFSTKIVAAFAQLLILPPPTTYDQAEHRTQLDKFAKQNMKLMLVAHSQGNLFVNLAYDYISPTVGKDSVKVVHIAPASPKLKLPGDHILAGIDWVINGLRLQGIASVPDINLMIPFSSADISGHKLVDTYLDSTRRGEYEVRRIISVALDKLTPPAFCLTIKNMSGTNSGTVSGISSGIVMSAPAAINCGGICSASFASGASVTLTATPDPSSIFSGWTGACTGTATNCTVAMDQEKTVTAVFGIPSVQIGSPYPLTYRVRTNNFGCGTDTDETLNNVYNIPGYPGYVYSADIPLVKVDGSWVPQTKIYSQPISLRSEFPLATFTSILSASGLLTTAMTVPSVTEGDNGATMKTLTSSIDLKETIDLESGAYKTTRIEDYFGELYPGVSLGEGCGTAFHFSYTYDYTATVPIILVPGP